MKKFLQSWISKFRCGSCRVPRPFGYAFARARGALATALCGKGLVVLSAALIFRVVIGAANCRAVVRKVFRDVVSGSLEAMVARCFRGDWLIRRSQLGMFRHVGVSNVAESHGYSEVV